MDATGIVLAGGRSRRMGRDKAYLEIGGVSNLERAVRTMSRLCDEVIIAGGHGMMEDRATSDARWVHDPPGASGPMAGLAAGLAAARYDVCAVIACDMPFVNDRLLARLVGALGESDAIVPKGDGVPQSLHAVYARRCLPTIESLLRLGARSMRDLLPRLLVTYVSEDHCRAIDPAGLSWFNMNTPDDYNVARQFVA